MPRKVKPKLVVFTIDQVRAFNPCYDPIKYIPEGWKGTVIDVLKMKEVSSQDKLWVVCREEFLDAGLLRRFAVAQAKTCRKYVQNKKEFDRILKVCTRYSKNKATYEELNAARIAAGSVAWSAAENAAWSAAESAAESDACSAADRAAWWAADLTAYAVGYAAGSVAWSASIKMLIKMVREHYSKE